MILEYRTPEELAQLQANSAAAAYERWCFEWLALWAAIGWCERVGFLCGVLTHNMNLLPGELQRLELQIQNLRVDIAKLKHRSLRSV